MLICKKVIKMGNTENTYQVCIKCFTFNHVNYIEDAMHGFVMQQTNFPYVAVVVDDASTDGEPEVIKNFLEKGFDMASAVQDETEDYVRVVAKHKTNVNCTFVVVFLKYNHYSIKKARIPYFKEWYDNVKYIALCEGDDYWTDPLKLQKQVDYLEGHEDYSMCVNRTSWLLSDGSLHNDMSCCYENDRDLSTDEIIRYGGLYVNTVSTVYRNKSIKRDEFQWWKMADVGDYPLHIAASLRGRVRYFADDMSVYRYQCEGSWTSKEGKIINLKHFQNETTWLLLLDENTSGQYREAIYSHLYGRMIRSLYLNGNYSTRNYLQAYWYAKKISSKTRLIKDILIHYFPFLKRNQ